MDAFIVAVVAKLGLFVWRVHNSKRPRLATFENSYTIYSTNVQRHVRNMLFTDQTMKAG
jgi:hypothetical protein